MIQRRLVPDELPEFGPEVPAVLARIYASRGVGAATELDQSAKALANFELLGGIDEAVRIIANAIRNDERLLIVGDYDADGATSTALMMRALAALGASHVDYLVPNRFEFGYGLTPAIVAVAAERKPDVLITVDNGISSIDGVASARAAGMRVVVTDHHLPGAELPEADAIVNPNCEGDAFPSKALAGVGVAFYLMAALRAHLRKTDWFNTRGIGEPNLAELLDLVALGTVADVVPLDRNNRVLVHQGMARIRANRCVPGILALLEVGNRDPKRLVASDLGFAVGPRLNAAGRLDDMTVGIECLLATTRAAADPLAGELNALNQERKEIEAGMSAEAANVVANLRLDGELPAALSLFGDDWHPGVVGIVASRVKEQVHRPVVAFAPDDDTFIKGSARSVEGVHIKDVLERMAAEQPDLIVRFGGHAMAAGLTLERTRLESFSDAFARTVAAITGPKGFPVERFSDGSLTGAERTLQMAECLREGGPWGQTFPEPAFDDVFEVLDQSVVGGSHLKLRLVCAQSGQRLEAIAFNQGGQHPCPHRIRVLYRLDANTFGGRTRLQLIVEYLEGA